MEYVALVAAALNLVEKLLPEIERLVASGQMSVEEQKALWDRYVALRDKADAFSGPEWKKST